MERLDHLCCLFALAKNLAEEKMPCGVDARDKLLMDTIEAKQEEIFERKEGLAKMDKEKKTLKSVLKLVRAEVEKLKHLHGFWRLEIVRKSSGAVKRISKSGSQSSSHWWMLIKPVHKNLILEFCKMH